VLLPVDPENDGGGTINWANTASSTYELIRCSCSACDWALYNPAWIHLAQKAATHSCGTYKHFIHGEIDKRLNSGNGYCDSVQNILSSRLMSNSIKL
jgi:hypothetical protein